MKKLLFLIAASALAIFSANRTQAVELLISGNFEPPTGEFGEVPGWELQEFLTGSAAEADTASLAGGVDDVELWLKAFAGGGPLTPLQGNFDSSGLPAGSVDGRDFLIWQRNHGRTDALPSQGDASNPPDMIVNGADLAIWQSNYGKKPAGVFANTILRQTVPAAAGETYTFQGTSEFEEHYSGLVTTLGNASPHGTIASPTVTQFKIEFLNASGNVIGTPKTLDLRSEWVGNDPGFPLPHTPLVSDPAPAGTVSVRVVAEALNMAWNGTTTSEGLDQSAYFNDFSLTNATNPGSQLLENGDLNLEIPTALDFWNQVENPVALTDILRAGPTFGFANHTPGGTAGVWLSAFLGATTCCGAGPEPADGTISQTVEAVAGGTYTFSGWTKFEANYSGGVDTIANNPAALLAGMPSPTETEIKLEFLDINEIVIGSSTIDVREERQAACAGGNANSATCGPAGNGWLQHTLQAVAPANTIFARLTAQMIDGVFNTDTGGGQSAFFDDFSLDGPAPGMLANVSVPEPSSLVVLGLGTLLVGLTRNRK